MDDGSLVRVSGEEFEAQRGRQGHSYTLSGKELGRALGLSGKKYRFALERLWKAGKSTRNGNHYTVNAEVLKQVEGVDLEKLSAYLTDSREKAEEGAVPLKYHGVAREELLSRRVEELSRKVRDLSQELSETRKRVIDSDEFDDLCSRAEESDYLREQVRRLERLVDGTEEDDSSSKRIESNYVIYGGERVLVPRPKALYRVYDVLHAFGSKTTMTRDEICAVIAKCSKDKIAEVSALRGFERLKKSLRELGVEFEVTVDGESVMEVRRPIYWKRRVQDLISVAEVYSSREWQRVVYEAARKGISPVCLAMAPKTAEGVQVPAPDSFLREQSKW